jgi:small-conductance mechanosensitive channel
MRFKHYRFASLIVIALLAVGYGIYRTGSQPAPVAPRGARRSPSDRTIIVDQSSLLTAEQLVHMPTTADERPFAEEALRLADQEMDLAFAAAVRQTANRPRATSDEAKEAEARLTQSLQALSADQAQVGKLTSALAKASATNSLSLTDELNLAKAHAALDQDEVDDAQGDLRRAGGDPQGRMQEMIDEHDAASKGSDTIRIVVTNPAASHGLLSLVQSWRGLNQKELLVRRAKAAADSLAVVFKRRHDRVEARAAARLRDSTAAPLSHDSSAALLADTQRRAVDEKARASLDQRVDNQHRLSEVYASWAGVLRAQQLGIVNGALRGTAVILFIMLCATLLAWWIEHVLGAKAMDHRRTQTLYMVARVSLQVGAVLLILLVIFGPPDNLGTFLGLAGAGLTVALKDFIIAFIGWFVLMGRNGIRIGDLVEINGVTGEVVQLGVFYTVLLETGGWTESGHPTGRRVTFTNSFAIEGHYFNFSTAGQWLWDEVRIVVPAGRDPYTIAESLQKQAEEATAESTHEAEVQWREARRSPQVAAPTVGVSVNLKPISGGVEITVRYITRATEREQLRSKLYHSAVDLLGSAAASSKAVPAMGR